MARRFVTGDFRRRGVRNRGRRCTPSTVSGRANPYYRTCGPRFTHKLASTGLRCHGNVRWGSSGPHVTVEDAVAHTTRQRGELHVDLNKVN